MRKLIPFLILAVCAIPAMAQTVIPAFTVPAGDNSTICESSAGVLSICPSYQWTYANGVITINGTPMTALNLGSNGTLTASAVVLIGGVAYAPGTYNVEIATGGAISYVPVGSGPSGKIYTVALTKIGGTSWAIVSGLTLASGQQATAMAVPTHSGAPVPADWYYYSNSQPRVQVDTTGAVYVGISNSTAAQIATASVTVTVK